jgi:hypothetical protein
MACPVKNHKLVCIVEDCVCLGYHHGEDVTFCSTVGDVEKLLQSGPLDISTDKHMLVKLVPYIRNVPLSPRDVRGDWGAGITSMYEGKECDKKHYGDASNLYYSKLWNINSTIEEYTTDESAPFLNDEYTVNTVTWTGHHRLFNPKNGLWDIIALDDGPFGSNVYKGVVTDRGLGGGSIKDMDFERRNSVFSL